MRVQGAWRISAAPESALAEARSQLAVIFFYPRAIAARTPEAQCPGWVCAGDEQPVEMPGLLVSPLA